MLLLLCDGKNTPTKKRTNGNVDSGNTVFLLFFLVFGVSFAYTHTTYMWENALTVCIVNCVYILYIIYLHTGYKQTETCMVRWVVLCLLCGQNETGFRALHIYPQNGKKTTYKRKYLHNKYTVQRPYCIITKCITTFACVECDMTRKPFENINIFLM